jgi:hypothetical protein
MKSENSNKRNFLIVMGLALGLPSTIVGVFFLLYNLVIKGYVSWNFLLIVLVILVTYILVLMVKNGLGKKN